MKKIKFMLVALLALFGFNNAMAEINVGQELSDNDYYYVVKTIKPSAGTGTVYIKKINSAKSGEITLPTEFVKTDAGKTYTFTVTGIADAALPDPAPAGAKAKDYAAFKDQTSLTKVTVPSTYEYIGSYAFYGCTNLAAIDFSGATGLKTIADKALVTIQVTNYDFSACTKLTGFTGTPFVDPEVTDNNLFITSMTLPTSNAFKRIGTALAHLPNLETLNISESKVTEIVANAFTGDKKLTAMELPSSVEKIYGAAFEGSSVATLTINAASANLEIGAATGAGTSAVTAVYGADAGKVLTSLTINGTLKGDVKSGAFAGEGKMETLALNCTFATTGQIESEAFAGIDKIEKVTLGDITDHTGGGYTIMSNAFYGKKLTEVEIGNITTANAIAEKAFYSENLPEAKPTLTKVTIASVVADGEAIAAQAFLFADAASSVTIGEVHSNSASEANRVLAAGAFTFTAQATIADPKICTITIGAVSAQGNNFAPETFKNTTRTVLTFNGDIEADGIDQKILKDNSLLWTLTFNGKVGPSGIKNSAFANMPNGAVVNFNGALAGNAVAAGAFALAGSQETYEMNGLAYVFYTAEQVAALHGETVAQGEATKVGQFVPLTEGQTTVYLKVVTIASEDDYNSLTVNYNLTNVAAEDVDETVNPFDQKAFLSTQLTDDKYRSVTLNITPKNNTTAQEIFTLIAEGQISCADPNKNLDIIYAVKLLIVEDPEALTLLVWEKTGTNTSYGRWELSAEDYPKGLKIARRGNDGVKTLTLYTTYVEDDNAHKTLNINMQPIVSTDGYYYLPADKLTKNFEAVLYADKDEYNAAKGTNLTGDQFAALTDAERTKTPAYSANLIVLAKATGTNSPEDPIEIVYEELPDNFDANKASVFYTDYRVKVSDHVVTNEQLRGHSDNHANAIDVADGDDLYFITNPEKHNGIAAPMYDFRNSANIFIDRGSFIVTGTHYAGAQAARIIWHDGEEEATAIMAAKKVVTGNSNVIYNLAGQKVSASYKGIVIKNGKKMIQK